LYLHCLTFSKSAKAPCGKWHRDYRFCNGIVDLVENLGQLFRRKVVQGSPLEVSLNQHQHNREKENAKACNEA